MTTWVELGQALDFLGGRQASATMWLVILPGRSEQRQQRVFVGLERLQPDLDFVRVFSPVALLADVRADAAIRRIGQMTVGMVGFNPLSDENGYIGIGTVIPLHSLDLSNQTFLLYLNILAQAADRLESELQEHDAY